MSNKITSWSYSRWADYDNCPRKAFYKYVEKLKEPENEILLRGTAIHKKLEIYLKNGGEVPQEASSLKSKYEELRGCKPLVEMEIAFGSKWGKASWFGKDAWCRVKMDAVVLAPETATVYDHKTGKVRDKSKYVDQLELYCLAILLAMPATEKATASLLFVDHGKELPCDKIYDRASIPILKEGWEQRTDLMLSDTTFDTKPNSLCAFCHFRKSNGGPCEQS